MQEAIFNFVVVAAPLLGLFAALFVIDTVGTVAINLYHRRRRKKRAAR